MSAIAETTFNSCYVIKTQTPTGELSLAFDISMAYRRFPVVMGDCYRAHTERLGSLTPVFEFNTIDQNENRYSVFVLEILIDNTNPPSIQVPNTSLSYVRMDEVVKTFRTHTHNHHAFSVFTDFVIEETQRHIDMLGISSKRNWFAARTTRSMSGKITVKSSEDEADCFCNETHPSVWWTLPCNHCFHHRCIEMWHTTCMSKESECFTCPMCREPS